MKAETKYIPFNIKGYPKFNIAYWDINSGKKGPSLLVTSALHGNEVQGSEALRRFCPIAEKKLLKGRMILVPFANPLALWNRRPHIISTRAHPKGKEIWDEERKIHRFDLRDNINCTWPGNPKGNEAEQITNVLFNKLVKQATHLIDMHCWQRFLITAGLSSDNEKILDFVKAAALPAIYINKLSPEKSGISKPPYILSTLFEATGRISFDMEFSGQYIIVKKEVERGVRMLCNCSKYLGMFKGKPEGLDETVIFKDKNSKEVTVKAPENGLFVENGLSNGDYVKKGSLLGVIFSDRTLKTINIKAPVSGYLYSYGHNRRFCDVDLADMHPYADKDDTLAIIIESPKKKTE